jgi:hypothetical protein
MPIILIMKREQNGKMEDIIGETYLLTKENKRKIHNKIALVYYLKT